ncbi:nitroreductase [Thiofilum flexile]|uniref:nitroreductase n=1 Tax=Thiofilum flexile TaxID=125627 RepID=UPI00037FD406|nr:nitroreductase [Thiofilum flexile]
MKVADALRTRQSIRAFLPQAVDKAVIEEILTLASTAPSGTNTQPWRVAVVSGESKIKLQSAIETAFRTNQPKTMEYKYYPDNWVSPYIDRRRACGLQMYSTLEIKREDKQRQLDQWAANYRAFDAPVMLLFFMDKVMETGSYMDYGMFLQSIMLAALEKGLATCPQAALGEFPQIVREQLGYSDNEILLAGMALGYPDMDALVNSYRTPREPVASFARFFD